MRIIILGILFLTLCLNIYSQELISATHSTTVEYLASKELKGRKAGTPEELIAAEYLASALKRISFIPIENNYLSSFTFQDISGLKRGDKKEAPIREGINVAGYLDNNSDRTILLGAHYDHLGYGKHINSRSTSDSALHFGADDNASGVATVLGLAQAFSQNGTQEPFNIIVAFFSAEEIGLIGSKAWLASFKREVKIDAMLNFDMVGRMKDSTVSIFGVGTSPEWEPFIATMDTSVNWELDSSGLGPSDHATFYLDSIPVLHFFTGQHEDYHKETDTYDKINYAGMLMIHEHVYNALMKLSPTASFSFNKTKDQSGQKRPKLKVTMGIMPSYTAGKRGMRIDGVVADKPAEKAGLLKGDEIIKIGEYSVTDIYDYMDALGHFDKGDKVSIIIIRNKQIQKLTIEF